jgi:hypothetical protein
MKLLTFNAVPTALHKTLLSHIYRKVTEQSVGMSNSRGTLTLLPLSILFNPKWNSKSQAGIAQAARVFTTYVHVNRASPANALKSEK